MPASSATPGWGAVACTPYGGALRSDHVSSMTLTDTQMRLPCGQWNSFATSTSLTSLIEDGDAQRKDRHRREHPRQLALSIGFTGQSLLALQLAPLDARLRDDLGPSF